MIDAAIELLSRAGISARDLNLDALNDRNHAAAKR